MKNKLLVVIGSIVVLGVLFWVGSTQYKKSERNRIGALSAEQSKLFHPEHSPVFGSDEAKVTVTEFLDPECESCRMFYPKVKKLLKMYEGKVKFVVRYAAFHRNSKHAIRVLEATRKQNKYWESLELLFEKQPEWADHHNPQPELVFNYLPEVGVDIEKIKVDMKDPKIDLIIEKDMKDLELLNVRGTPTFFVDGKPLDGFGLNFLYNAVNEAVQKSYKE